MSSDTAPRRTVAAAGGAQTSAGHALDAADGVLDGKYYGRQIYERGTRTATGKALDAADGVVDGKFYGREIYEAAGAGAVQASF